MSFCRAGRRFRPFIVSATALLAGSLTPTAARAQEIEPEAPADGAQARGEMGTEVADSEESRPQAPDSETETGQTPASQQGEGTQPPLRDGASAAQPPKATQVFPAVAEKPTQATPVQPALAASQPAPSSPSPPNSDDAPAHASRQSSTVSASPPDLTPPSAEPDNEQDGWEKPFGLYLNLGGAATFTTKSTHAWSEGADCPEVGAGPLSWNPDCSAKTPIGAALEGRIGFRFWFVALEGFALGAIDWSSARLGGEAPPFPLPSYATEMTIGRVGGGLGGGLRFISPPGWFRIGLGIGGGAMFRHVYSNVSSLDGSSTGYTAPMGRADLTITLADTIKLGVMGWVEKSKSVKISPDLSSAADLASAPVAESELQMLEDALGDVTVFKGNQYFIGPYLGLHFGS